MRRFFVFSLLFQWIMFLAAVSVAGIGLSGTAGGLLADAEGALTDPAGLGLALEYARMIVTTIVIGTLTVAIWAMLLTVGDASEARRDRVRALVVAFSWTLLVAALCMAGALIAREYEIVAMLAAVQVSTLLTALVAGGVEYAWEDLQRAPSRRRHENDDVPRPAQMFVAGARTGRHARSSGD